ncbi:MAG: DUF5715 family protein [Candidatus Acidiferrales bacterium]
MRRLTQPWMVSLALMLAIGCSPAFARTVRTTHRSAHANLHRSRVHRVLWTPLFRPSRESMVIQNEEVDRSQLPRIQNEEQLEELVVDGELVPIVPSEALRIEPQLDPHRRYCRPWARDFVNDLSVDFYQQFHEQIQINSAVRTAEVQKKLRRHNRNAAPESGELASSHLAGISVDLQRFGMTREQVQWVEQYMLPLKEQGLIEPEEERGERCFHVMVSSRYDDWRDSQNAAGSARSTDPANTTAANSGDSTLP